MGIRGALRLARATYDLPDYSAVTLGGGGDVAQVADLPPEIAVAFGLSPDGDTVNRADAMTIPAVRRGRQVIAGTIGTLPLVAHRTDADGNVDAVERQLLEQPDPNTTRQHVLTWTVDDLLFYGISWWVVTERDATGYPIRARRVAPWEVTCDLVAGTVYVNGQKVADRDVIRFDGPDEGVIRNGGRTLKTCLLLEQAVRRFATLDVPLGLLRPAEGAQPLTEEEVSDLLDAWADARRKRTTGYLNRAVEYEQTQFNAEQVQLADSRMYQAAEIARLLNLPPRYVNAPQASGMTYANAEAERRDLVDTMGPYLAAIEQRLSLGDVTPRGQVVRFDLTQLVRGTTLDVLQAAEIGIRLGVLEPKEVRTDYLGRAPKDITPPAPTPAEVPA